MLTNNPNVRNWFYIGAIALAAVSVLLAVGVIFFNWFTQEQVFAAIVLALGFYNAFIGALAKANLSTCT